MMMRVEEMNDLEVCRYGMHMGVGRNALVVLVFLGFSGIAWTGNEEHCS